MEKEITACPLTWPTGVARTPSHRRKESNFGTRNNSGYGRQLLSIIEGRDRVMNELGRYGSNRVKDIVISSDVPVRNDGLPYANARMPDDPGVCVYFTLDGMPIALPCDTFRRFPDNLAAIAGHIEADRRQERYGVGTSAQRFAGFAALPAPGETSGTPWYKILDIDPTTATPADVRRAYKRRALETHPDRGGTDDAFHAVQQAFNQALAATGG